MPFEGLTHVGSRNHVLDEGPNPSREEALEWEVDRLVSFRDIHSTTYGPYWPKHARSHVPLNGIGRQRRD